MNGRASSANAPCRPVCRQFRPWLWPMPIEDGVLDLLAVEADGSIIRISDQNQGRELGPGRNRQSTPCRQSSAGEVRLHVADLDNNGALDLFLSPTAPCLGNLRAGALIWLGDEKGKFVLLDHPAGSGAGL